MEDLENPGAAKLSRAESSGAEACSLLIILSELKLRPPKEKKPGVTGKTQDSTCKGGMWGTQEQEGPKTQAGVPVPLAMRPYNF